MTEMTFDADAVAQYAAAAAAVTALLGDAARATDTAASVDLAGLGEFGRDFAQAWRAALASQADTVRLASGLVDAYAAALRDHATAVLGIDATTAAALTAAAAAAQEVV